jgi:malate dehydrogenase (oxaloacetate-decarboxylating)
VIDKPLVALRVVINGAGAAGTAIAKLLRCADHNTGSSCVAVGEVIVCDSKGAIHRDRENLSPEKTSLLEFTNPKNEKGTLHEVLGGKDVFIGVSKGNLLTREQIKTMNSNAIVFGLANPTPEIFPDEAKAGGAAVVGTGRSDFPNQINNVLVFPGLFRGALDAEASAITNAMKLTAAKALAESVAEPSADRVLPSPLDRGIAPAIAAAVKRAALGLVEE